jgi:heat shock protein 4
MNQEETVARGCAVQAAMLSPLYKVKEFGVVDINTEPILMQTSQLDMEVEEQPETLFNDKNAFPITKLIKFTRNKPFKVDLFYNHLANGLEQTVGKYQINLPQTSDPATVKVAIKMNIHGVVNVESAEKIEVYYETPVVNEEPKEAKTEEAKPEEAKTESEVKPKKKTRKIPLEVQAQVKGIFGDELKQYRAEEKRMSEDDRVARETLEKKNELESFVYDWRDKLNGTYKDFTTQEVISHVFEALRQVEDWLYGDGSDTLKSVYIEKLNSLKEFTDPILKRYSLHTTLPSTLNELYTVVTQGTELANTTHENYSHITTEDRQKVIEKCIEQHNWYSEQLKVLQSTPRHQDIPISTEDLVRRTIQLKEFIASVMNRPKPAPQPKSAPEPQPAKEEKEVPGEGTGESKEEEKMDLD